MKKIEVGTKRPYEVLIGRSIMRDLGWHILSAYRACKAAIVTDETVAGLYLEEVQASLKNAGFSTVSHVIKSGERYKTPATYLEIVNFWAQSELGREDIVVALGGGVVGDTAGFAAATYMRGIEFIQVPTTLLAAIDASVGGKTGVDLPEGKNLLGAFHQPLLVFCDVEAFKTLSPCDIKNGAAEGIKYAALSGGRVLDILQAGLIDTEEFVLECVKIKSGIVQADEKEKDCRRLLNLGHTLGHAMEKLSDYQIPHGQAVAKGMNIVARASNAAEKLPDGELETLTRLFLKYDLDTSCPFSPDQMIAQLKLDKKASGDGEIYFVDILGVGNCVVRKTAFSQLKKYIEKVF